MLPFPYPSEDYTKKATPFYEVTFFQKIHAKI